MARLTFGLLCYLDMPGLAWSSRLGYADGWVARTMCASSHVHHTHVCMYTCMYIDVHVCMYMYACMYLCMRVDKWVCG